MIRYFLGFSLLVFVATTGFGQRFGHLNFGNLLSEMPATAVAEKQLEAYNKEQLAIGEGMAKKLQADFASAEAKASTIPPVELRKLEAQLQKDQQAIRAFEQQMAVNLEKKRRELLGPIIKQAKDAIAAVGREKGYQMIFDSSLFNSLLFTGEGTDVLPLVKAKLGIQ
ncbi:OmpH family outer membrane protein [Neolewinella lacunae]|uniref:OmpH family outer membrane protein n=1 Tax=Neolewinella lacunae TaxID=1517758 RepID=A0A923T852_9BACT|nr:OmpH family outer membrane protein [Neolewinella lacunae]MBC6994209.1 OmpH family outer membrane protein [Neolewinella lacunae]MDN3634632.1 OmpH family outer membrane protein [Neolewinella lacunae]